MLVYPLRWIWKEAVLPENVPAQVAFSVSKRRFKRAVDRNRVKRMMREAYRLNKAAFYEQLQAPRALVVVYIAPGIPAWAELEQAMKKSFHKLTSADTGKKA